MQKPDTAGSRRIGEQSPAYLSLHICAKLRVISSFVALFFPPKESDASCFLERDKICKGASTVTPQVPEEWVKSLGSAKICFYTRDPKMRILNYTTHNLQTIYL